MFATFQPTVCPRYLKPKNIDWIHTCNSARSNSHCALSTSNRAHSCCRKCSIPGILYCALAASPPPPSPVCGPFPPPLANNELLLLLKNTPGPACSSMARPGWGGLDAQLCRLFSLLSLWCISVYVHKMDNVSRFSQPSLLVLSMQTHVWLSCHAVTSTPKARLDFFLSAFGQHPRFGLVTKAHSHEDHQSDLRDSKRKLIRGLRRFKN